MGEASQGGGDGGDGGEAGGVNYEQTDEHSARCTMPSAGGDVQDLEAVVLETPGAVRREQATHSVRRQATAGGGRVAAGWESEKTRANCNGDTRSRSLVSSNLVAHDLPKTVRSNVSVCC